MSAPLINYTVDRHAPDLNTNTLRLASLIRDSNCAHVYTQLFLSTSTRDLIVPIVPLKEERTVLVERSVTAVRIRRWSFPADLSDHNSLYAFMYNHSEWLGTTPCTFMPPRRLVHTSTQPILQLTAHRRVSCFG